MTAWPPGSETHSVHLGTVQLRKLAKVLCRYKPASGITEAGSIHLETRRVGRPPSLASGCCSAASMLVVSRRRARQTINDQAREPALSAALARRHDRRNEKQQVGYAIRQRLKMHHENTVTSPVCGVPRVDSAEGGREISRAELRPRCQGCCGCCG